MRIEPLTADHLSRIAVQPQQAAWRDSVARTGVEILTTSGNAGWAMVRAGQPVAAMGVIDMGGGRASAWGLLSHEIGAGGLVALHRAVRRFLAAAPYRRVEAVTAVDFRAAGRWVEMLGFNKEGVMRAYCFDGGDAELWARVTHG
jgi:RimJ/RimL family protein N-acetyltransferase